MRPFACAVPVLWLAVVATARAQSGGSGGVDVPADAPAKVPGEGARAGERGDAGGRAGLVDLRPRWTAGRDLRLRVEQAWSGALALRGLEGEESGEPAEEQTMEQRFDLTLRPGAAREDGLTPIDLTIDAVRLRFQGSGMDAEYDSTRPAKSGVPAPSGNAPSGVPAATDDDALLAALGGALVGTRLSLTADRAGNITGLSGGGGLNLSGLDLARLGAGGMGGGVGGLGGGDAFGAVLTLRGAPESARVGDAWTTVTDLGDSPVGGMVLTTTSRLVSHRGGIATIRISGEMRPRSGGDGSRIQIQESTHEGEVRWDTERGELASADLRLRPTLEGPAAEGRGLLTGGATLRITRRSERE